MVMRVLFYESVLQRVANEVGDGVEVQFAHEVGAMPVDGLDAEAKRRCNLRIRFTRRDVFQNLLLASGQVLVCVAAGSRTSSRKVCATGAYKKLSPLATVCSAFIRSEPSARFST